MQRLSKNRFEPQMHDSDQAGKIKNSSLLEFENRKKTNPARERRWRK